MKKVAFISGLKDPEYKRPCSECHVFTTVRCIVCKDYTCIHCIKTDKCFMCT